MQAIDYIREHGLASLCEKYAIKASRGQKYPNLVLLKYSQIDSPMGERIVQECRGALKTRCSAALFAMRKGLYKTAREFFADSNVGVLEKIIKPQVKLMEAA